MAMELLTTEVVTPVGGKSVKIHEGDGYNDRILLKKNKRLHQVLPEYLFSLIDTIDGEKPTLDMVMKLLVPDYEFLLIKAYILNYGENLEFRNVCSACGDLNSHSINLANLPMIPLPEECKGGSDPVIDLVLPRTKKRASVGFLTVANDMIINEQMVATGTMDMNQASFLALRELEGCNPIAYENVIRLPLMDHKAIRGKRKELVDGYDPLASLICESCQNYDVINVLGLRDFLYPSG